jgi:hypothetical protein
MSDIHTSVVYSALRHPDYLTQSLDWTEWRETYAGGKYYRDRYLEQWKDRETDADFLVRKNSTPIPTFAKEAITEIRNAIFQRLEDVLRIDGSPSYMRAVKGEAAGVDRKGTAMNSFIGIDVLTELLVMGRTGVYVDAPDIVPQTLFDQVSNPNLAPYCYHYRIEDILSYDYDWNEAPGTFRAVLLRDYEVTYNTNFKSLKLPIGRKSRRRLVYKDESGRVRVFFYEDNDDGIVVPIPGGDPDGGKTLEVDTVPFILPDIGQSLMIDIASYQHALLNLVSGDVNWSIQSSQPFLTIQKDRRSTGDHLKQPGRGNTPEQGGQRAQDKEEQIGGKGRYYDLEAERPGYIHPSSEPLKASMELRKELKDELRQLVNLAIANKIGTRTESAEAKKLSSQGLEAGLSYVGEVLEELERKIGQFWSMYEHVTPPVVTYPGRWILKQDIERIEEATKLAELMDRIPSQHARRRLAVQIVTSLLGGKENADSVQKMVAEIGTAGYTSGVVADVIQAHAQGLVSDETASEALGYDGEEEIEQARKDKAERAKITLLAQTSVNGESGLNQVGPGARGVPDIDPNEDSGKQEKDEAKNDG